MDDGVTRTIRICAKTSNKMLKNVCTVTGFFFFRASFETNSLWPEHSHGINASNQDETTDSLSSPSSGLASFNFFFGPDLSIAALERSNIRP